MQAVLLLLQSVAALPSPPRKSESLKVTFLTGDSEFLCRLCARHNWSTAPSVLNTSHLHAEVPGRIWLLFLFLLQNSWKRGKFSSCWNWFEREEMLPDLAELGDPCDTLPICVQTLNVDVSSLSLGISDSPMPCVDAGLLLGITTMKYFKWWVGCSDRGDSYVTNGGMRLAHSPENADWSSEESGVWLMHLQCKKWSAIVLCFSICDFAMWIDYRGLNSTDFLPANSGKHWWSLYKEFLGSLLHIHINSYWLGWLLFNRVLKSIWRKFLLRCI